MISSVTRGLMKLAVPISMAVAPAMRNSIASSVVVIPPMPTTGIFTACATCQTILRATGLTAGPDNPPTILASFGRLVLVSMAMPRSVLISETASAPPASTALAMTVISVTLGESLTISGRSVTARTASVTFCAIFGSVPKATPPFLTLGQEILISRALIPSLPLSRSASA